MVVHPSVKISQIQIIQSKMNSLNTLQKIELKNFSFRPNKADTIQKDLSPNSKPINLVKNWVITLRQQINQHQEIIALNKSNRKLLYFSPKQLRANLAFKNLPLIKEVKRVSKIKTPLLITANKVISAKTLSRPPHFKSNPQSGLKGYTTYSWDSMDFIGRTLAATAKIGMPHCRTVAATATYTHSPCPHSDKKIKKITKNIKIQNAKKIIK